MNLSSCTLCPHRCGVDRSRTRGFCRAGDRLRINLWQPHHGEEPAISGTRGSGTIFFSHCAMRCLYCQNHRISHLGWGRDYSIGQLAEIMLELQDSGVHNLNLVTPGHFTPLIRQALELARRTGLNLPVVWNSGGYEAAETLRTMEGLVDIYLPDFRYGDAAAGRRYSGVADYPARAGEAILEMFRQVGHLAIDDSGLARRGLLVRLLVLPGNVNRLDLVLAWLADHLGPETWISLMAQYYPTHRAVDLPPLDRPLTTTEYETMADLAEELGFANGFLQEVATSPEWTPDFK